MNDNIIFGRNSVLIALLHKYVEEIYISESASVSYTDKIKDSTKNIKLSVVSNDILDQMTNNAIHQGVVAKVRNYGYSSVKEILDEIKKSEKHAFIVILDHIQDTHNFGAIIRTCKAVGVNGIIIPKDRQALVNPTVIKSSSGYAYDIKIAKVTNLSRTIEELKENNIWIYSLDSTGENIYQSNMSGNIALVIGNEGHGISDNIRKKSDGIISIPMEESVESLNASVACAVSLYEIKRQNS